ncbi:hypothetical protein MKW98_005986 [Papaver atlanticum]|uniref:Myb/SANT-like DNA-binding domain-containing protein n=1 Tax=Papaver atlanticum TaxID=357466 RepID=A0AAD4S744_9MAGN|nr:hypothetical protein MKW98_005986 [Papaver atlanticum]
MNNDEWFFSLRKEDYGGGVDATGDGGEEMKSQVRVSSNTKGPSPDIVARLQDIVQEPNVSPMEEEVGMKTTHSCSDDTVFREFRNEDAEDELDESLCRKREREKSATKLKFTLVKLKEKDSIMREEIWLRKVEERRAQYTHRSLALLSLLENFFGQQVITNPGPLGPQEINSPQSPEIILHDQIGQKKPTLKRWPKHEQKLRAGATKFQMWKEISLGMASMGFTRTAKHYKEKWNQMDKCFEEAERRGKTPVENSKTRSYFHELDMFYKKYDVKEDNPGPLGEQEINTPQSTGQQIIVAFYFEDRYSPYLIYFLVYRFFLY